MLEAGVHFGHRTRYWCPKMAPYIYGAYRGLHILDLEKALPRLDAALNRLSTLASMNRVILFVGTKRVARTSVVQAAEKCGMPYVNRRWLGGTLTNYDAITKSVRRLEQLENQLAEEREKRRLGKKELLKVERQIEKLNRNLGGIRHMDKLPDALFVLDVGYERLSVREANKMGIEVFGIVDSNNSPTGIDEIIIGNDDSLKAINLYLNQAAEAILAGKATAVQPAEDAMQAVDGLASDAAGAAVAEAVAAAEEDDSGPAIKVTIKKAVSKKTASAAASEKTASAAASKKTAGAAASKKTASAAVRRRPAPL